MGTIKADTISDKAGTGPIVLTGQSAAKAWALANTITTVSIINSANMSSITDHGLGDAGVSFTNGFSGAAYSVPMSGDGGVSGARCSCTRNEYRASTAAIFNFYCVNQSSNAALDRAYIDTAMFGDLV